MWGFLSICVCCGTVLLVGWRLERILRDSWDIEVAESEAAPAAADPMPHDLQIMASAYSDRWAREDLLKRAEELRARLSNWDEVRTVLRQEMGAE